MFMWLLLVTLVVSVVVCFLVTRVFNKSVANIMTRLVSNELASAWQRYITFAIYVVGVSGGVRIWALERYITPGTNNEQILELNAVRWVLEVYRTIIETLQGIAWLLLVFLIFALLAYVILRGLRPLFARFLPWPLFTNGRRCLSLICGTSPRE